MDEREDDGDIGCKFTDGEDVVSLIVEGKERKESKNDDTIQVKVSKNEI